MSQMFSPFTLYKPYLPPIMMYAAVRTKETLLTNSNEVYLEKREVTAMRKKNPPAAITDEEVYRRAPHKEKHQQQSVGLPCILWREEIPTNKWQQRDIMECLTSF